MRPRPVLLAAGSNAKGQLGIGSHDDAHTFTPCQFAGCEPDRFPDDDTARVAHIACGANHTVLLLEHVDGTTTLWGAGDGRRGQLGPGALDVADSDPAVFHKLDLALPTSMLGCGGTYYMPRMVAAAWETTYVVMSLHSTASTGGDSNLESESDVLLSFGSNDFGALGIGGEGGGATADVSRSDTRVVSLDHVFSNANEDSHSERPRTTRTRTRVRSLHAGPRHVVAELSQTRTQMRVLVGWGASRHGQLGEIRRDGGTARFVARPTVLPIDVHEDPMVSCALGNQHTVVLHASGRVSALGSNKQGQIPPWLSLGRDVCRVGCTWNGTYVQRSDGTGHVLLSMGNDAQGQLGRGDAAVASSFATDGRVGLPADRAITTFVCGSEHVLVVLSGDTHGTDSDSVLGWGWNEHGNMGLGTLGNVTTPRRLWPREDVERYGGGYLTRIWAGCATSWLLVE